MSYSDIEFSHIESFAQGHNNANKATRYGLDISFRRIFITFTVTYAWTLLLTAIPLTVGVGPYTYYAGHRDWYSGNDMMRIIEPIGGFILNFIVLQNSGIFRKEKTKRNLACIFIFFFGAALYSQGAGYHSAANMFKNALDKIEYDDPNLTDLAYYMRTIWEHIVGHYMYATGYVIMNGCQAFAYRELKAPQLGLTLEQKVWLVLASSSYALLIAGVAADFPSGTIVSLIYLLLYGFGVVGGYILFLYKTETESSALLFGYRPVLHHFLLSYCMALVLVIAWISYVGGFRSRSQANIL